tara:strand:- start:3462 stop:3953 length:492 start_codon:yes stop_codon:yes gene_type:complete
MLKPSDMMPLIIGFEEQLYVDRVRSYLGDFATANKLDAVEECTDTEIFTALQDALEEINYEFLPQTSYTFQDVPSFHILQQGAVLEILTRKGILSARNTITYNDSGGVTVQDTDKYGRYVNYFNVLIAKYQKGIQLMKVGKNVELGYGGVHSEYLDTRDDGAI